MTIEKPSMYHAALSGLLVGGLLVLGVVHAETYRHGNSTTIIQQHGGSGASQSRIERYPDGQKIITRSANSSDITIQRKGGAATSRIPEDQRREVFRRFFQRRFSGMDWEQGTDRIDRDAFRQRIQERFRNW